MNYPVDVEIYLSKFRNHLMELIENENFFKNTADEFGLDYSLEDSFIEFFMDNIAIEAMDNYNEFEDPTLTQSQFLGIIKMTVAETSLESMKNRGLVECVLNDDMQPVYRLTEKGLAQAERLK